MFIFFTACYNFSRASGAEYFYIFGDFAYRKQNHKNYDVRVLSITNV